jgi:hypothetical protein
MGDFEKMIAKLKELVNERDDVLWKRVVAERREWVVTLCVLREKLKGTTDA